VDQVAIAVLSANKAIERSLTHKLKDTREAVFQELADILQMYKSSMTVAGAGAHAQLSISDNLKMLPVLIHGLLKNVSHGVRGFSTLLLTELGCRCASAKVLNFHQTFRRLRKLS
jgi:hypothetical protein